jgi:hypothetical protein
MPYIEIDVDLDEFDTDDLIEELSFRVKRIGKKGMTDKNKQAIKEPLMDLLTVLNLTPDDTIEVKTLDDKIKYEHIASVFEKYTAFELQSILTK